MYFKWDMFVVHRYGPCFNDIRSVGFYLSARRKAILLSNGIKTIWKLQDSLIASHNDIICTSIVQPFPAA